MPGFFEVLEDTLDSLAYGKGSIRRNRLAKKLLHLRTQHGALEVTRAWREAKLYFDAREHLAMVADYPSPFVMREETEAQRRMFRLKDASPLELACLTLYAAARGMDLRYKVRRDLARSHYSIGMKVATHVPYGR